MPPGGSGPLEVVAATPLSGEMIAAVWRATLSDGRDVVVKATGYDATFEAEGLDELRRAGGPTPEVIAVDRSVLVMEHVSGPGDREVLGAAVATVHRDLGEHHGWHRDNVIGPLPQSNRPAEDWVSFYVAERLTPYLDDLPTDLRGRLVDVIEDGHLVGLLDHGAPPSLLHGDLWTGNVVDDRWLIDPAVHRGDRELDLAMLDLFGSVDPTFLRGYEQVWPLDEGVEARRPALQLYHLLVHVRLFGHGYLSGIRSRLDRLGW